MLRGAGSIPDQKQMQMQKKTFQADDFPNVFSRGAR